MTLTMLSDEDARKYENQYVAVRAFDSKEVVGHGTIAQAREMAREAGVMDPVIIFVPAAGVPFFFCRKSADCPVDAGGKPEEFTEDCQKCWKKGLYDSRRKNW